MNILLFGVSNVGKSVSGRLLADLLGYSFYDLDDEVKKDQNTTLEKFVSTGTLRERDAVRCRILNHLVCKIPGMVIFMASLSGAQTQNLKPRFWAETTLRIRSWTIMGKR